MIEHIVATLPSSGYRRYLMQRTTAVVCQRLLRLGPIEVSARRRLNGKTFRFRLRDHLQCLFYFGVSSEPENSALIRAIGEVARGDLIDVGANYGQQPYEVRNSFRRMLLFEPNSEAAVFLRNLFKESAAVEVVEMGASDVEGDASLFFPDERQSGVAAVRTDDDGPKICLTTIDAALASRELKPCLIKIDVEGLEENVLRGARETIREHLPILAFESDGRAHLEACRKLFPSAWKFYRIGSSVKPALRKTDQVVPVAIALLRGSQTYIHEIDEVDDYISLVYVVPTERDGLFHEAIATLAKSGVGYPS